MGSSVMSQCLCASWKIQVVLVLLCAICLVANANCSPVKPVKVFIQGSVSCKTCKYKGLPTTQGDSPLPGATVKLVCTFPKYRLLEFAKTDKAGNYFFLITKLNYARGVGVFKYCRVFLVSSPPKAKCKVPTSLNGGSTTGALLVPVPMPEQPKSMYYFVCAVASLAFDPPKKCRK